MIYKEVSTMARDVNNKNPQHPWDDNLPKNKEYIKKFHKKSEKEIEQQESENKIKGQNNNN